MPDLHLPPKPAIVRPGKLLAPAALGMLRVNQLVGFGAASVAAAAPPTTLSFFASSSSSTSGTITLPASILSGDVIFIYQYTRDTSAPATVVPTGYTAVANISSTNGRVIVSYKISAGSDSGASVTIMTSGVTSLAIAAVFRGDNPVSSITIGSLNTQITDGNPTSQTCTASSGVAPLVVLGCYGAVLAVSTQTFSPTQDGEISPFGTPACIIRYKIYNASPVNVAIDEADGGNDNSLISFYAQAA